MPNWVRNKIIGNRDAVNDLIKKYASEEEDGRLFFDFNKVIPMPEELKVEFSTKSNEGVKMYLAKINPNNSNCGVPEDKVSKEEFDEIIKLCKDKFFVMDTTKEDDLGEYDDELVELGRQQIENIKKYNAPNWYVWSINNWGTKWNSSNLQIVNDGLAIQFDSAWDPAIPVIVEIGRQNPGLKLAMMYADEDMGSHVGYIMTTKGEIDINGSFHDKSVDAYKLAFDLWGNEDDYEYDAEIKTFKWKGYEEDEKGIC